MPLGVTGNTPDSGSGESWFEPRRGNGRCNSTGRFLWSSAWRLEPRRGNAHDEKSWAFVLGLGLRLRAQACLERAKGGAMKPGNDLAVVGLRLFTRLPYFRRSFSALSCPRFHNFLGASITRSIDASSVLLVARKENVGFAPASGRLQVREWEILAPVAHFQRAASLSGRGMREPRRLSIRMATCNTFLAPRRRAGHCLGRDPQHEGVLVRVMDAGLGKKSDLQG